MTRGSLPTTAAIGLGLVCAFLLRWPQLLLAVVTVPLVFVGIEHWERWSQRGRTVYAGALTFVTAATLRQLAGHAKYRIEEMREWDFVGFWLHARSALNGVNFYKPGSAQRLARTLEPSAEFQQEIVDVGFWYPPPSMFYFLPAGLPDIQDALVVWYVRMFACIAGSCVVLWRVFFPGTGVRHLACCAALIAGCYGAFETIDFGQTNFLLLLCFSLFLAAPERLRSGVFLALAMFAKPFVVIAGAIWLLRRQLKPIAAFIATAVAMTAASFVAFGSSTFMHFFVGDKGVKPDWIYFQPTNTSALGFLNRLLGTGEWCEGMECAVTTPFLVFVALSSVVTLVTVLRLRDAKDRRAIALLVLFALMVYPVSQTFYSVMLVPLLLILRNVRHRVVGGYQTVALLGAIDYALCFHDAFIAYALTYLVLLLTVWWPADASAGHRGPQVAAT